MKYLPLVVLLIGLVMWNARNRQKREVEDLRMRTEVVPGTEVMTTSGLYGRVTAVHADDDTVTLAISPGVEGRWAFAAIRDAKALPDRYRKPPGTGPNRG